MLPLLVAALVAGCGGGTSSSTTSAAPEALLHPERLNKKAPQIFDITFHPTKGDFVVTVNPVPITPAVHFRVDSGARRVLMDLGSLQLGGYYRATFNTDILDKGSPQMKLGQVTSTTGATSVATRLASNG